MYFRTALIAAIFVLGGEATPVSKRWFCNPDYVPGFCLPILSTTALCLCLEGHGVEVNLLQECGCDS